MALEYGFYNSKSGDRRYDAEDISSIFDGIVEDGVYASIGDKFAVTPSSGMVVNIGTGRAWFEHTWSFNPAKQPITIPDADVANNRIDAIMLVVDKRSDIRKNYFMVKSGTPAVTPAKPTVANTTYVFQHIIAYVTVGAGVTSITADNIENTVGTDICPFVTAPLQTISISTLLSRFEAQVNNKLIALDTAIQNANKGAGYLRLAGGTMLGPLSMGNRRITNVASPSASGDAVPHGTYSNMRTYTEPAQIPATSTGLTLDTSSGPGAFAERMPDGSVFVTNVKNLTSSYWNFPNANYGLVEVIKYNANRILIMFYGKVNDDGIWKMNFSDRDATAPNGTWTRIDPAVTTGAGTRIETYTNATDFSCSWSKYGRVVIVSFKVNMNSSASGTTLNFEIASGLPKALSATRGSAFIVSGNCPISCNVSTSGMLSLTAWSKSMAGDTAIGSITYIAAE